MKQVLFLLCFFAGIYSVVSAQQKEFIFKNFTQEEGLPSNETYCVFEDSRHFIWIGTDYGVVRYNGNKFETFNLPDNVIFKIREDSKGRIWFFTRKAQLAYFENEKIYLFKYNDSITSYIQRNTKSAEINITDSYVDDSENIHLNSSSYYNYIVSNKGTITDYSYSDIRKKHNEKDTSIYEIDQVKENFFFAKRRRYNFFHSDFLQIIINSNGEKSIYNIPVQMGNYNHYGCLRYSNDIIYFFAGDILIRLNKNGSYIIKKLPNNILSLCKIKDKICAGMIQAGAMLLSPDFNEAFTQLVIENKSITGITADYERGYWFSTLENGLYYTKNMNVWRLKNSVNLKVSKLLNDQDKNLFFATKKGLHKLENKCDTLILYKNNIAIDHLITDSEHNLFIACSANDGTFISGPSKMTSDFKGIYLINTPYELGKFKNGDLICNIVYATVPLTTSFIKKVSRKLPCPTSVLTQMDNTIFKPGNMFVDKDNNVWGAANDGLYTLNKTNHKFEEFHPEDKSLDRGTVYIRQLQNGILAVGSRFTGIVLIKGSEIIGTITEKGGLLNNKIKSLLPIGNQLWVATPQGLSVITFASYFPLKYTIQNIAKKDGIYNLVINDLAEYQGNVFVATNTGLYCVENIQDFFTASDNNVPLYFSSIHYNSRDTQGIKSISVPYVNNEILVKYNSISFNSGLEISYLYRFDKNDTAWHITTNTELPLENLRPGTYHLQMKAVIPNQNRSSSIQELTITVEKPWWQNNWLRLLAILLIAGIIYWITSKRIKKIREEEKRKTALNTRIAELEQTALRSQMNPHFIFNCLTSIQQLIVSGNKIDANEYLVKFARLIRKTLELSAHHFIPLREKMEYLNDYLYLEQLRLSKPFEYSITKDEAINAGKILIPNMMVQPIVENCIRHGIKSLENKKGIISIHFKLNGKTITCTITDNGVGRTHTTANESTFTKHKSYGIDIVQKRMELFETDNINTGIEIKDLYNEDGTAAGTQVILQLPYKTSV